MSKLMNKATERTVMPTYIKLENEILHNPKLTSTEKIIYSILKNRLTLSMAHNYTDSNGDYFVWYKTTDIARDTGSSERTVRTALKKLSSVTMDGYHPLIKLDRSQSNTYRIFFYELNNENGLGGYYEVPVEVAIPPKKGKEEPTPSAIPTPVMPDTVPTVNPTQAPVDITPVEEGQVTTQNKANTETASSIAMKKISEAIANCTQNDYPQGVDNVDNTILEDGKNSDRAEIFADECENSEIFTSRKKDQTLRNTKLYKNLSYLSNNNRPDGEDDHAPVDIVAIKEQLSDVFIDGIKDGYNDEIVDDIYYNCLDMLTSKRSWVKKESKERCVIEAVLARLTYAHVVELVERIQGLDSRVKKCAGYIKTMIYNICLDFHTDRCNFGRSESFKYSDMYTA